MEILRTGELKARECRALQTLRDYKPGSEAAKRQIETVRMNPAA
jgi:hypothetical protein